MAGGSGGPETDRHASVVERLNSLLLVGQVQEIEPGVYVLISDKHEAAELTEPFIKKVVAAKKIHLTGDEIAWATMSGALLGAGIKLFPDATILTVIPALVGGLLVWERERVAKKAWRQLIENLDQSPGDASSEGGLK